jgi:hypothetical protein
VEDYEEESLPEDYEKEPRHEGNEEEPRHEGNAEEPRHEDYEEEPLPQALAEDSVEREVVLVALEAAALSRRAFPEQVRAGDLTAEGRQALLALSLADPSMGLSVPEVAHLLSLGREETLEAMAELVAFGLATGERSWDDEADEEDEYRPTARGSEVALELATVARRAMPGWPPRHR